MERDLAKLPKEVSQASLSFEELARIQGVQPVTDFDSLLGSPWPDDESAEEFSAMLREWRREGTGATPRQ